MPAIEVYRPSTYQNRISSALTLSACFICTSCLFLFLGKSLIFGNTDSIIIYSLDTVHTSMQCDSQLGGILFYVF